KYSWYHNTSICGTMKIHKIQCSKNADCDCGSLDFVEQYKYLGVIIDSKISWSIHVNYIAKKFRFCNIMLYKLKYSAGIKFKKLLYYSGSQSRIQDCNTSYASASQDALRPVAKAQDYSFRFIRLNSQSNALSSSLVDLKILDGNNLRY